MIQLGSSYIDSVTGFIGTAVSRTEYLGGWVRVGLENSVKPGDSIYFDEPRLAEAKQP